MQAKNSTAQNDLQLLENGYEPIPVAGKAAVAEGWQRGQITPERIAMLRELHPVATNTGLRTGRLATVDIDVRDTGDVEAIVALADAIFGPTPLRRFGSKGLMLCYRNDTPIRKITVLTAAEKPGDFADKVEILGTGLQFVAFGIHPDTGKHFEWQGKDDFDDTATPLNTPLSLLPNIGAVAIQSFADECAKLMGTIGYKNPHVRKAADIQHTERPADAKEDTEANISRAKEHLNNCVTTGHVAVIGALGNDTIYELACVLLDRFYLSPVVTEKLMLEIWYPHCIPNTLENEVRTIIAHAVSYIQNEPGARAAPPVAEAFHEALDKLPVDATAPEGPSDLGEAQQIVLQDENYDNEDKPTPAGEYTKKKFPPLRELIPIWCERNTNTFLEGPAATQKSRAALQDAICLSAGLPVMGQDKTEPCDCIYLNYENSEEEMARRVHMICDYLRRDNQTPPVDPSGVQIWELRKHSRPIIVVKRDGVLITRFGRRFLSLIATRRNAGKHTLVIFDGLMDAIIFNDNTRNDDATAMALIRLIDSWCAEYDFTAYSIVHPSRTSERGGGIGSYATAWTTKPRAIQTFKRVLAPFAGGGPKAKITEDTPLTDIWFQRRVQKRSNGPEGERMLLEYCRGGLRPNYPEKKPAPAAAQGPVEATVENIEEVPF